MLQGKLKNKAVMIIQRLEPYFVKFGTLPGIDLDKVKIRGKVNFSFKTSKL